MRKDSLWNIFRSYAESEDKMNAEIKWLDNPEVFRVNQLPAHSDHSFM